MRPKSVSSVSWLVALLITLVHGVAQTKPTAPPQEHQDPVAQLNPQQKQQFEEAKRAFDGQRYADARAIFTRLLLEQADNILISKYASDVAMNTGDATFALEKMRPIAQANPDDWQATALLLRACAETGDNRCRDSGIAHMADLQSRGLTPPGMQAYLAERVKVGGNTLEIRVSLVPWGPYKVWALGQFMDADGKLFRASLESSDFDQVDFAKKHPEEAGRGIREFSLDGYQDTGMNSNGQRTQKHYTYKFFVGQPSYETIREEFIKIASGKAVPMSSRTGLIVP